MSADNGVYILGPCKDGKFRVAYASAVENLSYPSKDHPEAIEWAKNTFFDHATNMNNIELYRPILCNDKQEAYDAAYKLKKLYHANHTYLEYGICDLGRYSYV